MTDHKTICYFNHFLSLLKYLLVLLIKILDGHPKVYQRKVSLKVTTITPDSSFATKVTIIHILKIAGKFEGNCFKIVY